MALAIVFIILFGSAAAVPAVWSIVNLIRGNWSAWPCVAGTVFALVLLGITFGEIGSNWGGCPPKGESSEGAVQCYQNVKGKWQEQCEPDVWKEACHELVPPCGSLNPDTVLIPRGQLCPSGHQWQAVFPFCEPVQLTSSVKQPWATWSDLSFVAAGLWLLWFFQFFGTSKRLFADPGENPMSDITVLSVAYCFIVIFMGPPSMWYHASMKQWGGWFDTMSVVAWLGFNAFYVIYAIITISGKARTFWRTVVVLGGWGVLMVVFGLIAALNKNAHLYLYFATGGPWGIAEVVYLIRAAASRNVQYRRTWFLFVINLGLLAVTMTIWIFFNDGVVGESCAGRAGFPGHALFHILASFSTMLTFFSFASERSTAAIAELDTYNPFRNA